MTDSLLRILIADDHPIVLQGLFDLIEAEADLLVAGQAESGDRVLDLLSQNDYDVILLDIAMPGKNGLDTLDAIHQLKPSQPVLIYSHYPEALYAAIAMRAGANGFISKGAAPDELLAAVRNVARGNHYLCPSLLESLINAEAVSADGETPSSLTNREFQIFYKLARGESLQSIAETLGLSVKTISSYRSNILQKLHLDSNADLIRYAVSSGLVQ
ncbi:Response regulator UvrY [Andreprevotia sp. IGB-42]|uniref:response regulator n=1 Tax=Andreprevotia sp. IGB-42 TaxID=2497473 RepID=UPI00135785C7|nr:response regulator transcription factor [Andreprevotia sp. IGB-42]KAF0813343.1 Response regulator UvrY [Andreprevotia sp. IGB-42]